MLAFGLAAAAALSLPGCQCGEAPLVRVTISYGGFQPACVRLSATAPGAVTEITTVPVPAGLPQGVLEAAIFARPGWDPEVVVSVEAHEQDCDGPVVATDVSSVTVHKGTTVPLTLRLDAADADGDGFVVAPRGSDCDDSRADVHPGATEVCNGRDDNCAGGIDEGFTVGVACGGDAGCGSFIQCEQDGGTLCAPGKAWYRDGDQDGWGNTPEVRFSCSRPDGGYVPDAGDCDDGTPRVHPGLPEICDQLDNDCSGTADDGLGLGAGCGTPYGCPGQKACAPDGGVVCQATGGGTGMHPDEDGDGAGAPAEVCALDGGVALVSNADDCDDGDPFTALGFPEICDRRDNDCDGQVDRFDGGTSACPADAGWIAHQAGGAGHAWRSIWSWADGGAWVVGLGGKIRQHLPSDSYAPAVQWTPNYDGDCGNVALTGVWADPVLGRAYIVGTGGNYCWHDGGTLFQDQSTLVQTNLADPVSLVGFRDAGAVALYVVGRGGGAVRWFPDGGSDVLAPAGARLNDVHGVSPQVMFAAGVLTSSSPPDARLFRFMPPNGWAPATLPSPVRNNGTSVDAVYVVHPRLAYAVTDGGHVLKWDGDAWALHPDPPDGGALKGVLAFGTSSVFVIDPQNAWEWNGVSWTRLFSTTTGTLVDLHGTNPADIWVAQDPQMVYRYGQ